MWVGNASFRMATTMPADRGARHAAARFVAERRRQSRLVASGAAAGDEAELQAWLQQVADTDGWH